MLNTSEKALIIVDVQNDFCPGGSLAVPGGDEVIRPLNKMIEFAIKQRWKIYASRDWHPEKTKHFEKWPVHCVQNTRGAEFHAGLYLPESYPNFQVVSKGLGDEDDYSFFDSGTKPKAKELYVGGLATDYCVLWTVMRALCGGYKTTLLLDACRAVNIKEGDGQNAVEEMRAAGAIISTSEEVLHELD